MEEDRHLMAAEIPDRKPDVLIVESTYGVQVHASRAEREARFTGTIERVVTRGGRCLIPVFALGRAQVSRFVDPFSPKRKPNTSSHFNRIADSIRRNYF